MPSRYWKPTRREVAEDADLNILVDGKPLSPMEQALVREYMVDPNPTRAARAANYTNPNDASGWLMSKPRIQAAIQAARRARIERLSLEADEVVEELMLLAFASFDDVAEWGEREDGTPWIRLKDKDAAPPAVWRAVSEVRIANGVVHIRLHDKLYALSLLGRHMGLYRDRLEVEVGVEVEAPEPTAAEVARELRGLSRESRDRIRQVMLDDLAAKKAAGIEEKGVAPAPLAED